MFLVVMGVLFGAPALVNVANRVVTEILIPNKERKILRKRRQAQAEAGIPQEQREKFHHLPLHMLDLDLTEDELKQLMVNGTFEILKKASKRRAFNESMDKKNASNE